MKKVLSIFVTSLFLLAFTCESDNGNCDIEPLRATQANLVTLENLQPEYEVGDILWITSELDRFFELTENDTTVDLFEYGELQYHFNLDKLSAFDSSEFLCVNENTLEIDKGEHLSDLDCNHIKYVKEEDRFISRVGIKLLEAGNYTLAIKEIQNLNEECNFDGIILTTPFELVTFEVK